MKMNGPRDRLMAACMPALLVGLVYLFGFKGKLQTELAAQTKRYETNRDLPPPARPAPVPVVDNKAALAAARAGAEAAEKRCAELRKALHTADTTAAAPPPTDAVAVVGKIEGILKRHKLAPLLSAESTDNAALAVPIAALAGGAAPAGGAGAAAAKVPVWHLVLDGNVAQFRAAMAELAAEVPSVVPLGLNFAYNPDTENESRLLELWLLY